ELLQEFRVPLRVDNSLEDVVDDVLLLLRVKVAADVRLRNLPVIRDKRAEQAPARILMIPGETNLLFLRGRQAIVEGFDSGLRGARRRRRRLTARNGPKR